MDTSLEPLPHIDEVKPLSEEDAACIAELRAVLGKHGKLRRFGIRLLHEHFRVEEDEILMETCDPERRILQLEPMKLSEAAKMKSIDTTWRLDSSLSMGKCTEACGWDAKNQEHVHKHHQSRLR